MIQTRSAESRSRSAMLALLSSDITASPGRCSAHSAISRSWAARSPASFSSRALEALAADLGQQLAGDGGRPGGVRVVVVAGRHRGVGQVGARAGGVGHRVRLPSRQLLKRLWVRSRPAASSDSTASAARSTWKGSTLRSTEAYGESTKSAGDWRPGGRPMPTRTR